MRMKNLIISIILMSFLVSCAVRNDETPEKVIKKSSEIGRTKEDEEKKQELLLKIIRDMTSKYYTDKCPMVKIKTESFRDEIQQEMTNKNSETDSPEEDEEEEGFSIIEYVKQCTGSIPEISKNGRTEEVTKRFFAENIESMDIRGLEKSSCEKDGFISDAECVKQIDGQLVKKSGKCGNTEISFSVPVLDPATNLVFVYKFKYCGVLCASSDLVVYELKSNGDLEMKYWLGLISS